MKNLQLLFVASGIVIGFMLIKDMWNSFMYIKLLSTFLLYWGMTLLMGSFMEDIYKNKNKGFRITALIMGVLMIGLAYYGYKYHTYYVFIVAIPSIIIIPMVIEKLSEKYMKI